MTSTPLEAYGARPKKRAEREQLIEDYLPLVRGEIILDLRREEDGWLFGWSYRFGRSGWYRPSYVKTMEHVCSVCYMCN